MIRHRAILAAVGEFLGHASAYQLTLTQVISIYPGDNAQGLHQDENAWDYFPFPDDHHVHDNTLWALSDYTAHMGATHIVPGSHLPCAGKEFTDADCRPGGNGACSVLLRSGKIWHSATRWATTATSRIRSSPSDATAPAPNPGIMAINPQPRGRDRQAHRG